MISLNSIESIPSTSLELGLVTSSILQLEAKKGNVNYAAGLWPFEQSVYSIGVSEVLAQYNAYVNTIVNIAQQSTISTIITVGIESSLNDILAVLCEEKYQIVMIPNSQHVDSKRIKMNYNTYSTHVVDPYRAWETYMGINTIIVVPIFRLGDGSIYMYSYPRRFMGSDVNKYSFRCIALELLPAIQDLDYRTSPAAPELCELSNIEGKYFNMTLTF